MTGAGTAPARRLPATLAAALWMAGALVSFSAMAVAGREATRTLDTFELMTWRSLIGALLVTAFALSTGRLAAVRTKRMGLHFARNVFHFAGQNLWFYGVATIPLAQLFAFEFTTPIWVALLAPLVLGEALTRRRLAAVALGFVGILVVARPGLSPLGPGHLAAALSAVCFAGSVLATKLLSRGERVLTILFWMTWMQVGFGLITAGWDGSIRVPDAASAPWVLIVGLGGLGAHLSLTSALSLAPASLVAPMDFLRLPLIAVVGALAYGEPLEVAVFAGALMILAANLMNLRAPALPGAAR